MANLVRAAKPGNDWSRYDLTAYHIECHREDPLTFFGVQTLPQPQVDSELLTTTDAAQTTNDRNAELLHLLDMAMAPPQPGDSAVDDFAAMLLRVLGYAKRNRVARTRRALTLFICGKFKQAQTDVCIIDCEQNTILLIQEEDKRFEGQGAHPEAQLIAEAIAAFSMNNEKRVEAGKNPFDDKMMPGIVMMGTAPTFYKIPVTKDLLQHVAHGTYPPNPTRVTFCQPPVSRPARWYREGMKPLDNRRRIFSCYEAFKAIVGI